MPTFGFTSEELNELRTLAAQWGKIVSRRVFGEEGPGLEVDFRWWPTLIVRVIHRFVDYLLWIEERGPISGVDDGRSWTILLSEPGLLERGEAGPRQPERDDAVRTAAVPPVAPLLHLQDAVLRAEGDAPVRLSPPDPAGRVDPGPRRGGDRHPENRPAQRCPPGHGGAVHPTGWRSGPATPRRVGGFFPRRRPRARSMRSGRSSPRKRRTAPRTNGHPGIAGTTRPLTRNPG
jgi:hypothetical protein